MYVQNDANSTQCMHKIMLTELYSGNWTNSAAPRTWLTRTVQ